MTFTPYASPVTPILLFVACAIVPVTWVPCPSSSSGVRSLSMKSYGAAQRFL
jgi:hypothetical protein